jgi:hypothetical protein
MKLIYLALLLVLPAQAEEPARCLLKGNLGSLYAMPQSGEVGLIPSGKTVLLVSSEGQTVCVLQHHVYPFVEKTDEGKFIASDLKNGQKIFKSDGKPFEAIVPDSQAAK